MSFTVWDHVTKGAASGQSSFHVECNYCSHKFVANASKIKNHLLAQSGVKACSSCPESVQTALLAADAAKAAANAGKKRNQELQEELDERKKARQGSHDSSAGSAPASTQPARGGIQAAFARNNAALAHKAVAKFFHCEGISLVKVGSPYFLSMIQVLQQTRGYVPPSRQLLGGKLLDDAVADVKQQLAPFDSRTKATGITISSDGWSDAANRPLLNLLATNPKGIKFVDAVDTSGAVKDGQYIASTVFRAIEQEGSEHVVQVVTDGAGACVSAGRQIEERYPHIIFTLCTAHCCDLALEDIGKIAAFSDPISKTKKVVTFINNHHSTLAVYRAVADKMLKKPGETRFGTVFIMLDRAENQKQVLQQLVVSPEWAALVQRMDGATRAAAAEVKGIILDDLHWEDVQQVINVMKPIVCLLKVADGNAPCTGKIYFK